MYYFTEVLVRIYQAELVGDGDDGGICGGDMMGDVKKYLGRGGVGGGGGGSGSDVTPGSSGFCCHCARSNLGHFV